MGPSVSYPVGLVLVAAGIFEWVRRFRSQPKTEDSAGVPSTNPPRPDGPDPGPQLMLMRWRSSFECGHPVIDMQHRELFNISNELINSVLDRRPKIGVEYLLHELVEHIKDHFISEEEVLARTHYPALEEHRNIHRVASVAPPSWKSGIARACCRSATWSGSSPTTSSPTHIIQEDLKFALKNR